ncbi:MAG: TorF family putative porin [Gammaproteobacteria bacterium]|nr:TorF family putative porin [Gammaproteobacteria bacterium]MDH5653980.1 TorF family putative porin [Gammaproteobacteria bacterium]
MPQSLSVFIRLIILAFGLFPLLVRAGDWYATVGAGSDYVFRGISQTGGGATASGGIEFVDFNNTYFGVWVSNTNLGTNGSYAGETDIYFGVSGKSEDTGYDFGYIAYQYPGNNPLNYEEFYAALSISGFTVKVSDSNTYGNYVEAALKFRFPGKRKVYVNLHLGRYNRDDFEDYHDANISLQLNELTFTISDTDLTATADRSMKVFMNWEHNLDF